MVRSPLLPSVLLCALAFVLGAEAVAAKCRNPLRVDGVVSGAVVADGVLVGAAIDETLHEHLEAIDPDDIHSMVVRCWRESAAPNARGLTVIVVMTKEYVASLGDVTDDEAVASAVAKADPEIRKLWAGLTV